MPHDSNKLKIADIGTLRYNLKVLFFDCPTSRRQGSATLQNCNITEMLAKRQDKSDRLE